jgi:UDP-N-acetylglucosamine 4,6-dehydratase
MKNGWLVTGGTGFLGRALARRLLIPLDKDSYGTERNARVCIYSRGEAAQAAMRAEFNDDPRLRWFIGDVRDEKRLRRAMESVEVVIHSAALKRIEVGFYNCVETVKTNIIGTMNVVEATHDAGVEKVVLISSDKAVSPVSPYGQSKALAESIFLNANNTRGEHGPLFAVTRYGNVWRSSGSVVPTWQRILAAGARTVPVTDPEATRFFMRIDEAVDLVLRTIQTMTGGEVNVPTLPAYRLGDLAEAMGAEMDVRGLPDYEKLHESMGAGNSSDAARRMSVAELREELTSRPACASTPEPTTP